MRTVADANADSGHLQPGKYKQQMENRQRQLNTAIASRSVCKGCAARVQQQCTDATAGTTTAMITPRGVRRICSNVTVSICVTLKKQSIVSRVMKYLPVYSVHSREALRVDMHSDVGMLAHSHILCHSLWLAVRCLQAVITHTF